MKGSYITKSHSFSNELLSGFVSACTKGYSTNRVLIKLIEKWKTTLYKNLFIGPVLMDLSKPFDTVGTVNFLNSYLKDRKRDVRINY